MHLKPTLRKATELGFALTAVATLVLAGCGGGSSSNSGGTSSVANVTTTITPFKGMFTSGNVSLVDANGNTVNLIAGGNINASGVASVTYPGSVTYPLTVNVVGTYLDETNGNAPATIIAGSPLQGLISAATSNVPVTAVTHIARNMLPSTGFSTSFAAAAITGTASAVLGVPSYAQAMQPPVFDAQGKSSDSTTIKLAALANVIGLQGAGTNLGAKLHDITTKLAAGSAVSAVIPQASFDAALAAANQIGGTSGVVPVGHTPPIIPAGLQCVAGGNVAPTPTIAGFSPVSGLAGTKVRITGTNLVLGFQPAPIIKFGTTHAGSPYTNVDNTGITFTVPAGLAIGTHTLTIGGMGGIPVTVGTFNVMTLTAPKNPTGFALSSTEVSLSWEKVPGATAYRVYRASAPNLAITSMTHVGNVMPSKDSYLIREYLRDTGLTANTTYYYRVVAVDAMNTGVTSVEVNATTDIPITNTNIADLLPLAVPFSVPDLYITLGACTLTKSGNGLRLTKGGLTMSASLDPTYHTWVDGSVSIVDFDKIAYTLGSYLRLEASDVNMTSSTSVLIFMTYDTSPYSAGLSISANDSYGNAIACP